MSWRTVGRMVLVVSALAGCGTRSDPTLPAAAATIATVDTTTATTPPPPTTAAPTTTALVREVRTQAWLPFAVAGDVTLVHPSARVERVAFHESNLDGAREMQPLATATRPITLETRDRGTGSHTAADIVVDPASEIRAPVSGRVKRSGSYTLYCEYQDHFVVIEPHDHPGWEVKILHLNDALVSPGDDVVAGITVVASGPHQLPFESQVDEIRTVDPAWPHVHVEVDDPTIPDRPTPGGCG